MSTSYDDLGPVGGERVDHNDDETNEWLDEEALEEWQEQADALETMIVEQRERLKALGARPDAASQVACLANTAIEVLTEIIGVPKVVIQAIGRKHALEMLKACGDQAEKVRAKQARQKITSRQLLVPDDESGPGGVPILKPK